MATQIERLGKLEDKVDSLHDKTVRIDYKLDSIVSDINKLKESFVGDGINRGFVNDIKAQMEENRLEIEQIKRSEFTAEQRSKLIHMAQLFEGWKLVLAGILYILPIAVFIYKIITE